MMKSVSVIIAMYNAERFIGDCLDSILAQTFQDFEVIVIDDCSTDNGNAIVRGYVPKFDGRLSLVRLAKNSGNNGIPNNMGLALSRGEYVIFLDADDAITCDALEKLYKPAKAFDADVVGCEKYYCLPDNYWNNVELRKRLEPITYQQGDYVDKPTLIAADWSKRVKDCYNHRFLWNIWSKLIRRDFLVKNNISITNEMANDMLLTCFLVYSAARYVRIPDSINIYRIVDDSLTHKVRDPLKQLQKYCRALRVGFEHLDKFLSGREFFIAHPEMRYLAFKTYLREILVYLDEIYAQIPAHALDETLRREFAKGDNAALLTFVFSSMVSYKSQLTQARTPQRNPEQEKLIQENKAYIAELEKFILDSQRYIAALEKEVARLKAKE